MTLLVALSACSGDRAEQRDAGFDQTSKSVPVGDRFFNGVVSLKSGSTVQNGSFRAVLQDPSLATKRAAGSSAPASSGRVVSAKVYLSGGLTIALSGTYDDETFTATGSGWTMQGEVSGNLTGGGLAGPKGEVGEFAGQNVRASSVTLACGSTGDGTFNTTTSAAGAIAGTFRYGATYGSITGSHSGSKVSVKISGSCAEEAGPGYTCTVSGGGTGSVNANGIISGSWNASYTACEVESGDCETDTLSGSFGGSTACAGPSDPPSVPDANEAGGCACPASLDGCAPCGICCIN